MKNNSTNMRDIKMILQKFDLQLCRVKRVKWGPYTLGDLKIGEVNEVPIAQIIKTEFFKFKKESIQKNQEKIKIKILNSLFTLKSKKK